MTRFCHPRSFRLTKCSEKHNIRSRPSNHCLPFVAEAESLLFASMNRPLVPVLRASGSGHRWKFLRHDNLWRVRKFRDGFQDHLRGSADDALQLLHPDRLP
jgi:hypothetical protein